MLWVYLGSVFASLYINHRADSTIKNRLAESGYKINRGSLSEYRHEVKDLPLMHLLPIGNVFYSFYHGGVKGQRMTKSSKFELLDKLKEKKIVKPLTDAEKAKLEQDKEKGFNIKYTLMWWRIREFFGLDSIPEKTGSKILSRVTAAKEAKEKAKEAEDKKVPFLTGPFAGLTVKQIETLKKMQEEQAQEEKKRQLEEYERRLREREQAQQAQNNPNAQRNNTQARQPQRTQAQPQVQPGAHRPAVNVPRQPQTQVNRPVQRTNNTEVDAIDEQIRLLRDRRARLLALQAMQRSDAETERLLNALGYGMNNNDNQAQNANNNVGRRR